MTQPLASMARPGVAGTARPVDGCPGCGGDEPFEQIHPDRCPDAGPATGGGCPEWACTACGAAVIMGTLIPENAATRPAHASRAA